MIHTLSFRKISTRKSQIFPSHGKQTKDKFKNIAKRKKKVCGDTSHPYDKLNDTFGASKQIKQARNTSYRSGIYLQEHLKYFLFM